MPALVIALVPVFNDESSFAVYAVVYICWPGDDNQNMFSTLKSIPTFQLPL